MENMEQTINNIELAYESVQQEIGERIIETVGRDLEGLIETMASMPTFVERCFDKETAELVNAWHRLMCTAGELAVLVDVAEEEQVMTEDDFFQAGVEAREIEKGQQKVIQMDPYVHPDEEINF